MPTRRLRRRGGAGVNDPVNAEGRTQLFIAARDGNDKEVERLIVAGADVNKAKTETGEIALMAASFSGYLTIVEQLIAAGSDINKSRIRDGVTALFLASQEGKTPIVNRLIAAGADINKARTDNGMTPLYIAAQNGHLRIVEQLIAAGADVNKARTDNGITPLYITSIKGHSVITQLLIDANADVNKARTDTGETTLYSVCERGWPEVVVETLIEAGVDVNKASTTSGETPLFIAAKNGHVIILKYLLNAGADASIANNENQLPIDVANGEEIRKLLGKIPKKGTALKWQGWTRGDASMMDGIFGDDKTARNFALCPVCMKYVVRSEACMYMSHNCSTAKGYYHEDLYKKYKNSEGIVNWCTICGRICKGHNHYNLAPAQGPVLPVIIGKNPFAASCEGEGGGGITEKLLRFRRLREHAKDLQDEVGKMGWWEAMDELCEEMWNAPMVRAKTLKTMQAEKKFNIPNTNFPVTLLQAENAPNVPNTAESPIIHPTETEVFTNAMYIDNTNILQFRHKMANGAWNRHDSQGQQISREAFIAFLKSMLENPTAEEFGKCWQYKTRSQQAALNATQKALVCDAVLHPEEVKAALDLTDAEQARLAEGYRKAFNAAMDTRKMYRP